MIDVAISQHMSAEGHPFSELRFTVTPVMKDDNTPRYYLSRVNYIVVDSPYGRQQVLADFRRRQGI